MKNIFKYSPGFLAGVILSSAFAGAAAANSSLITNTIDELWVFVAGDPVLASQVNENFEYLDLGIDANFDAIGSNSSNLFQAQSDILANKDNIIINQDAISQVDSSLLSFQSSQSVRDGDQDVLISSNNYRITKLESWPLLGSWNCQLSGDLSESFVVDFTNTGGHYTYSPFSVAGYIFSDTRYDELPNSSTNSQQRYRPITPLLSKEESVFFLESRGVDFGLYVVGRLDVTTNALVGEYSVYAPHAEFDYGYTILMFTGTFQATKL